MELRVFEGGEDVTFSYNANFFLFATLENARTIAQGRVPPSPASFPVLTGTPVAGMAYLDRPQPAGYFIFPDLSVRHEGKYRLSFSLYEELKEQKDMDTEEISNLEILAQTSQHVSHRLEVKSQPFTVFSAKKFPGLTESTPLSRMVAEQGCRVRIRRDVRMRRRENKGKSDDWDEYEDSNEQARRQSATPDAYGQNLPTPQHAMDGSDRPRSVSNASVASFNMPNRRPSMEQMSQAAYQQPYTQQIPPTSTSMYPPQLPYSTSQQQPAFQQPQQTMMQPPQMPFQAPPPAPSYAPPPPPPTQQMPMQQNFGFAQQQQYMQPQASTQQPAYEQSQHQHVRQNSMDYPSTPNDYRRTSMPHQQTSRAQYNNIAPPTTSAPFGQIQTAYAPTTQPSYASSPTETSYGNGYNPNTNWGSRRGTITSPPTSMPTSMPPTQPALAPLRTLSQPMNGYVNKLEPASPSYHSPTSGEPVHSPGYQDLGRAPPVYSQQQPYQQQQMSGKRTYSDTFDTHHMDQRLQYGARPNANGYDEHVYAQMQQNYAEAGSDGEGVEESAMSYRRADGTERRRRIPVSS